MWKTWYELAASSPAPDWTCMNLGLALEPPLPLTPEEEPERWALQLYERVASRAVLAGRDVLEIGCGRGGGAAFVARRHNPRRYVGLDRVRAAVTFGRRRFSYPGLVFEVGEAERLPFATDSFDEVLNIESSHSYGRFPAFLAEVRRVLRRGGHFLHADFRPQSEVGLWRATLEDAGFRRLAEEDLSAGVFAALEADDGRKRALIAGVAPTSFGHRAMASAWEELAGVRGSRLYEQLRGGQVTYRLFTLERSDTGRGAPASL
jgi:SAM-dependent methyltransferase